MKRFFLAFGIFTIGFLFFLLGKTLMYRSPLLLPSNYEVVAFPFDSSGAIGRLSTAITFATISHKPAMRDNEAFHDFWKFAETSFPLIWKKAEIQKINQHSRMLRFYGTNPSLEPLILLSHIDVVPVDPSSLKEWDAEPFSGTVLNGFVYGRGTLDDKGQAMAILEAVESMLKQGFDFERTLILGFGHDEEIGGEDGAMVMVNMLQNEGVRAAMILDEGGLIAHDLVPGMDRPVALIGTAEKGYLNIEIAAHRPGGHSSMPEDTTAMDLVMNAVARIRGKGFPLEITEPIRGFLDHIGPEMPFLKKIAFANSAIFSGIIKRQYASNPTSRALIQTTVVPTIFQSGIKDNVVPTFAKANLNLRLLPGWDKEQCVIYLKDIIDDPRIIVVADTTLYVQPSPPSSTDGEAFRVLTHAIMKNFPEAIPSPYLVLAATDARHFYPISNQVYRFMPFRFMPQDVPRIHGTNERLAIEHFIEGIRFYQQFIADFCRLPS